MNLLTEVLELLAGGGAKEAKKFNFHGSFCQISSDKKPKLPQTSGLGLGASDGNTVAPSSPPLVPSQTLPCIQETQATFNQ